MFLLELQDKHVTKYVWKSNERLLRLIRHATWVLSRLTTLIKNNKKVNKLMYLIDVGYTQL